MIKGIGIDAAVTPGRNTKLQFFGFAVDYIPGNHIEK